VGDRAVYHSSGVRGIVVMSHLLYKHIKSISTKKSCRRKGKLENRESGIKKIPWHQLFAHQTYKKPDLGPMLNRVLPRLALC